VSFPASSPSPTHCTKSHHQRSERVSSCPRRPSLGLPRTSRSSQLEQEHLVYRSLFAFLSVACSALLFTAKPFSSANVCCLSLTAALFYPQHSTTLSLACLHDHVDTAVGLSISKRYMLPQAQSQTYRCLSDSGRPSFSCVYPVAQSNNPRHVTIVCSQTALLLYGLAADLVAVEEQRLHFTCPLVAPSISSLLPHTPASHYLKRHEHSSVLQ